MSNQNQGAKRNEGCLNCGATEEYSGADNPDIGYICGLCTCLGVARQGLEEFEAIEAALKEARKPRIRLTKKRDKKTKTTLADC